MPKIRCVSPCNPQKALGEECGLKVARRAGQFCRDCENEAFRLQKHKEIPEEWQVEFDLKWSVHQEKKALSRKQGTKDNKSRRSDSVLKAMDQNAQNTAKKQKRTVFTEAKKSGDHAALLHAALTNPRRIRQQQLSTARGMGNVDFIDLLADDNIQLLAAASTDASMNHAQLLIDFGSKTAATRAMLELMVDYKQMNSVIMENCYNQEDYDCDEPISSSAAVVFESRDKKKTKKQLWLHFTSEDDGDIDHAERCADELDSLRKIIQGWYTRDCGVVKRRTSHHGVPYPSTEFVVQMVRNTITDVDLQSLFLNLLSKTSPSGDEKLCIEGILNGTFFAINQSTVAFHWCYDMLLFGFPSSRSNACVFNRTLWDDLLARASRKGHSRRYMLSKFILVWAAMDGSIMDTYFYIIIPDNDEMITFFREILIELHDGEAHKIYQQSFPSPKADGKSIVGLSIFSPGKLCHELLDAWEKCGRKYVPRQKADCIEFHASVYKSTVATM